MAQFGSEITAGKQEPSKDIELKLQQLEGATKQLRSCSMSLVGKLEPILSSTPEEKEQATPTPESLTPLSHRLQEVTSILETTRELIASAYNRLEI